MFITKRALSRRTFLRGMGVTVALPLLDAMVPALTATAKTAANPVPRIGLWQTANGVYGPDFKRKGTGSDLKALQMSPILAPLAALRDQTIVATGLSNLAAES